jgi:hypothetical protein
MRWTRQEPPLAPVGVLARGPAARALGSRALEALDGLSGLISRDLLLLLGPEQALPWVDGATWVGRQDLLLLPTLSRPEVPLDLLCKAIARDHPTLAPPWLMLPEPELLLGAGIARALDRTRLEEALSGL